MPTVALPKRAIGASPYTWSWSKATAGQKPGQGPLELVWPDLRSRRFDVTFGHSSYDLGVIKARLAEDVAANRRTNLRLHPHFTDDGSKVPMDPQIAAGDYDAKIVALGKACEDAGNVDFTMAPEVNGSWNHHTPYTLPLAWRRFGDRMDTSKVPMGFCYEPAAPYDLFDGISNQTKGTGKWWPGVKYVQRLELDPYHKLDISGPLSVDHGFKVVLTRHGNCMDFAGVAKKLGIPLAITEMGCGDEDITPEYVDVIFDFCAAAGVGLCVVNHINYGTDQFQGTSWAKGWKNGRIDDKPLVAARFKTRAAQFIALPI